MTFAIGDVRLINKRLVLITGGSYIGGYDRVSNHWSGRYIDAGDSGRVTEEVWHGYGDNSPKINYTKLEQRVIF